MMLITPTRAEPAAIRPVELTVRFKLTDLDYQPIPAARVRLVVGEPRDWQASDAGLQFATNAAGEHEFETRVALEAQSLKRPTNFIDRLLQRAEPVDFLPVAAELEYAGHRWLYVVELHRFRRDGDVLLTRTSVYSADATGRFTQRANDSDGSWFIADLKGLALTHPGHEAWEFALVPETADANDRRWRLTLGFKRAPAPVLRG